MQSALMIVPLLVLIALPACAIKLSALLLRYQVRWTHALIFSTISAVLALAGRGVSTRLGFAAGSGIGLVLLLTIGSWFFGERGRRMTGEEIGFARGAALVGIAQIMLVVVGLALIWGVHALRQ